MKILMYAEGFGVPTQTFITQDVNYLAKNHEILFVCTLVSQEMDIPNVTVKQIPFKQSFLQKVLRKTDISYTYTNKHFAQTLNEGIQSFQPDLIHCQFGIEALTLIDNLQDTSIPIVIQFRGYDASKLLRQKSYVKRLQEILDRPNVYSIFVSDSLRKNLNHYHINTKNHMILHSGIDLTKFMPEDLLTKKSQKPFIFLQISSLKAKKGHIYTLKAFAKFLSEASSDNYLLQLTGDGDEKASLEQLLQELKIQAYVEFIGFVSHDKAKVLLSNANVFVHHSITPEDGDEEGIPNALMEAMAMELPILSSYHAGIPELVTEGLHGYLVPEKDIDTYAQRMHDITSWQQCPQNRTRIQEAFEINYHIEKLERFYQHMIS